MTGAELQQLLDAHCEDMKRNMPGFLFYGILSTTDGNILSKASSNEETAKIIEEGSPYHLMIVNQVNQVLKTNLSSEQLELDYVLIETNKITFMLMISALGKFFSITALDRDKCNIVQASHVPCSISVRQSSVLCWTTFFRINTDEVVKNRTL